jgi:hypothetical protein
MGLITRAAYALLFCALPLALIGWPPKWPLFWLSVYAALYAAWALTTARLTSAKVLELIVYRIVPQLSEDTAKRIDSELARRFNERRSLLISWTIVVVSTVIAALAMSQWVPDAPFQIAWWSLGWLFLFATAARVTDVARFYGVFAKHLETEQTIYVLDPAHSILVRSVAAVGLHVLVFWLGIAISITFLVPFDTLGSIGAFHPSLILSMAFPPAPHSLFFWFVMPITTFFSLLVGTIVFLRSERCASKSCT